MQQVKKVKRREENERINFEKTSDEAINSILKDNARTDYEYYIIIKNGKPIGIIGILDVGKHIGGEYTGGCNIYYHIFEKYRNLQTKRLGLRVIDFPRMLGFDLGWIMTKNDRVKRCLDKFKRYGVNYAGKYLGYECYFKQYKSNKNNKNVESK